MTLRPLGDRVVVKRDPQPAETSGGIVIPETARAFRSLHGTVLACGPKCVDVKPGDRLLLPEYGGAEARIDGELLGIWAEGDLFAVMPVNAR